MVQFTPLLTRYLWGHMQQPWRCCSRSQGPRSPRRALGSESRLSGLWVYGLALSPLAQLKLRVAATESAGACLAERFSQRLRLFVVVADHERRLDHVGERVKRGHLRVAKH